MIINFYVIFSLTSILRCFYFYIVTFLFLNNFASKTEQDKDPSAVLHALKAFEDFVKHPSKNKFMGAKSVEDMTIEESGDECSSASDKSLSPHNSWTEPLEPVSTQHIHKKLQILNMVCSILFNVTIRYRCLSLLCIYC